MYWLKENSRYILAILALGAILVSGGFYADKNYVEPTPPPEVVHTVHGSVTLARKINPGDLITSPELKTVYYLNEDEKRVVFPDRQTFYSWYENFDEVKYVRRKKLESYPLSGRNVTIRPGTYLVTIPSSNQVWMIGHPQSLHWLNGGEEQVVGIFGENWSERLVDLPEYYFVNYNESQAIDGMNTYPVGQLIYVKSNEQYYLVTKTGQRQVTKEGMEANHFNPDFAIEREEPVQFADFGPPLDAYEPRWGSPDPKEQKADAGPEDVDVLGEEGEVL